jgi:hypothetical protein
MSGPSTKRKGEEPVFGPHPDDAESIRQGLEAVERDDALSAEESEAYVQALLGEPPSDA